MATIAAGGITGIAIHVFGTLIHALVGLPAPVAMLFLVAVAKLLHAVPAPLEEGARRVFRFFVVVVTDPPLFCTAVALNPLGTNWSRRSTRPTSSRSPPP